MTCIIGLEHNGRVYMGADSCVSTWFTYDNTYANKIFFNGEFMFGVSGTIRMAQLIEHVFEPPERTEVQTDMQYLVSSFAPELYKVAKDHEALASGDKQSLTSYFLLGYRNVLYRVGFDRSILRNRHYDSVGSGEFHALAAMDILEGQAPIKPKKRLIKALGIAAGRVHGVAPPFYVVKAKRWKGGK